MPEEAPKTCESCGVVPRPFDSVVYGSYGSSSRLLYGHCFNLEAARRGGLVDFEHVDFSPLTMSDAILEALRVDDALVAQCMLATRLVAAKPEETTNHRNGSSAKGS